jgi:hypothetical protein
MDEVCEVCVRLQGRLARRLNAEARRQSASLDELVREALQDYLARQGCRRRWFKEEEARREHEGATRAISSMNGETIN